VVKINSFCTSSPGEIFDRITG